MEPSGTTVKTIVTPSPSEMGRYAAEHAAQDLRDAIKNNGQAYLIVATGASQFEVLSHLVAQNDVDWSRVHGFHLDEYIGIGREHPASFCGYLKERFVDRVPLASFHYLAGDSDAEQTVRQAAEKIAAVTVDVALVGIGENGHLAFNDPPADFETESPYLIVQLDHECRMQQVGEGWFGSLDEVPTHAISMSVPQILKTKRIYCSVPDERKAAAVRDTLCGPITPEVPASILKNHAGTTLIIDAAAASKIPEDVNATLERFQ
ncbi:Glucosamine-6-phosphate deaminase 1 [Stieleria maiorica]|uniref:Glucosamine-6-phosphate deaminase 1 n=2 Tax=Stieleria maiorica TaxID=2795974 RepID=A0A5B9MJE0_9BACT|nr:Glucosamine-6-phosphate deaminase 1 [Stieleria maiorica]